MTARAGQTRLSLAIGLVATVALGFVVVALPLTQSVAAAKGSATVKEAKRGSLGSVLVTSSGRTLYRYGPDKPNKPTCTGSCASVWPPLLVPAKDASPAGGPGVSGLGTVKIAGGKRQVTYHKIPLYEFASDSGTSASGQNVGGFSVVHPSGSAKTAASSGSGATTTTSSNGYGY